VGLTRIREYQINTTSMGVSDPVTVLNQDQTGINSTDIGFILNRGSSGNVGFIWNESNSTFRLVYTSDSGNNQTGNVSINIADNAPIVTGVQHISTGNFTVDGDARSGVYLQRNITTDATLTRLYSNGANQNLVLGNNTIWTYEVTVTAKRTDSGSDAASFKITGVVGKNSTPDSIFLVGNPSITVVGRTDTTWIVNPDIDPVTGSFLIMVTGAAGKTVRWTAKISTLEVSFN
jgi:hypothetical protein